MNIVWCVRPNNSTVTATEKKNWMSKCTVRIPFCTVQHHCEGNGVSQKAPEPVVICKWEWKSDMQYREMTIMEEFKLPDTREFMREQANGNEAENKKLFFSIISHISHILSIHKWMPLKK